MASRASPRTTTKGGTEQRKRLLADLQDELARNRVPGIDLIARDLEDLVELDRSRGADWLENQISRTRNLAAVAKLAEVGRRKLYAEERHRAKLQLKAQLDDEKLIPEVERLVAEREPVKVIQKQLGLSKERVTRIKKLAVSEAAYHARFARFLGRGL